MTQAGQPGTPIGVFREDVSQIISATLIGPESYSQTVQLVPDTDRAGIFTGAIAEPPEVAGEYKFTIELIGTTQEGATYVLPSQSVSFSRVVGTWVIAREWSIRIGSLLLFLGAVAALGAFGYWVSPPHPRGTLLFQRRNSGEMATIREWDTIGSAIYLNKQKFLGFRTRSFTVTKGLPRTEDFRVRKMKVYQLKSGTNTGVRVKVLLEGSKVGQNVDFLRDGQAQNIGGGKYRLKYEAPPVGKGKR
ncbi:hypothetical protein HC928_03230 [bacterium]|nr:hypothetical protein [bacterium]